MEYNFVRYCLSHGGCVAMLTIPSMTTDGMGICNPSIFIDNDRFRYILRNVNYALWNSDNPYKFTTPIGPLCYITKNDTNQLITKNFICERIDDKMRWFEIDTTACDWEPQWEFVGHEDMRLVRWEGKLYGTGVMRDWNDTGIGRMHLSELSEDGIELSRVRIKAPGEDNSYCEKNWMPVLDIPYHYVKWCNPTEVVKVNPENGDCEQVVLHEVDVDIEWLNNDSMSIRGSSQVIPWNGYRIAIVHLCRLWYNEKGEKSDTDYFEQFIVWDQEWNVVKMSQPFKFANFGIEFTNGLAYQDGVFYIPFALQDNMAFQLTIDSDTIYDFIFSNKESVGRYQKKENLIDDFFWDTTNSITCYKMGCMYEENGHHAAAMVCFERACEYNTFDNGNDMFNAMYRCGKVLANIPGTDIHEKGMWLRMIDMYPNRSEGYLMLSRYYHWRGQYSEAYTMARLAYINDNVEIDDENISRMWCKIQYVTTLYSTEHYQECEEWLNKMKHETDNRDELMAIELTRQNIYKNKSNRERIL